MLQVLEQAQGAGQKAQHAAMIDGWCCVALEFAASGDVELIEVDRAACRSRATSKTSAIRTDSRGSDPRFGMGTVHRWPAR